MMIYEEMKLAKTNSRFLVKGTYSMAVLITNVPSIVHMHKWQTNLTLLETRKGPIPRQH